MSAPLTVADVQPTRGIDWLRFLPRYWFQNEPTDRCWDAILNRAIDMFGPGDAIGCTVKVGPFDVWIANWPYAYATCAGARTGLPLVRTRLRLRLAIRSREAAKMVGQLEAAKLSTDTPVLIGKGVDRG